MRIGGISSPELGGAQGLVGFPVQGFVLRDWCVSMGSSGIGGFFFTPFSLHPACGLG